MAILLQSRIHRWMLGLLVGWLSCALGYAQAPFHLQTFSTRQGLPQNRALCLAQDSTGFLWVGTGDGLARFDGLTFRTFQHRRDDPGSLPGDEVLGLRLVPDGRLLVATLSGMALYDARSSSFQRQHLHIPGQPPSVANWVSSFTIDRTGALWIATIRGLLRAPAVGRPAQALQADSRRAGAISSTQTRLEHAGPDPAGRVWVATVRSLNVWDPATHSFWNWRHNPRNWVALADTGTVRTLALDARGRVWYSIWNRGLSCFDPATNQLRHWHHDPRDPTSLPGELLNCLTFDRAGYLWIGTLLSGAARFDPATGTCQRLIADPADPAALPSPVVSDIMEDRQGNIWLATDGGLTLRSPLMRPFDYWRAPPHPATGTPADLAALQPDAAGRLWLGTNSQGLLRFDVASGHFHRVATPPLPGFTPLTNERDLVWTLAPAPHARLWVGTQAGLLLFDPVQETWEPLPAALPEAVSGAHVVSAALRARDGTFWFAAFRGTLVHYNPTTEAAQVFHGRDYGPEGGDSLVDRILRLAQDSAGNIWVGGATGRGISRLTAGTWRVRTWHGGEPDGPTDSDFSAMLADVKGPRMWLGTRRRGLNYYDGRHNTYRELARDDGLSSNSVEALVRDVRGRVWAATSAGLSEVDPRTRRVNTYSLAEGLPENQFTGGVWADASGTLWLTTGNYLVRVLPERLTVNHQSPAVALTSFQVNGRGRRLPAADSVLVLPPGENTLAFEFAALNLLAPARNTYAWQLEGVDRHWTPPGPQRAVTYADLPPGYYTLRVRAANNDGLWNYRGLTLRLRLQPPWYRTIAFYALVALAVAGLLYAFYRQRLARAVALERARNQIAHDLHDEIGSTLSSILIQSRVPTPTVEQARVRLQKIGDYAQPMLQAMDEIVWAVNPKFDPLPAVVARMRVFAAETLEPRGVQLHFEATGPLDRITLPLTRRRDFFLIFKEAVNNAAKYANATNVWVVVRAEPRRLRLEVRDDGDGFDPQAPARGGGLGLVSQRARARKLGGRLSLDTAPGQGTRLGLDAPA